ncbi:MAG: hypothetical protein PHE67_03135 [Campylobacterales bacterium]|nr:hypothetical protein [Campylobacterales bacterium]
MIFRVFLLIIPLFFAGCYSKCGITSEYYCDCKEYYDVEGNFHRECPDDIVSINIGVKKH